MQLNSNNVREKLEQIYDVLIVGGGAGGLSAGIYAQRFLFSTLVVDKTRGRSFWMQNLHNYLGLSPETSGAELLRKGKQHYLSLDGDYLLANVEEIQEHPSGEFFEVSVKIGRQNSEFVTFRVRYIVVASGIMDHLPELADMKNVFDFAGYNLHVCLICDGYEMRDKRAGVFINSEERLEFAYYLSWFTDQISVFTQGLFPVSAENKEKLAQKGFTLYEAPITRFLGDQKAHQMTGVELVDGTTVELETGLVAMGAQHYNSYLSKLNLKTTPSGNLFTDQSCRTSHPRVFAIGDLKAGFNQVSVAVGDGATAVSTIWKEERRKLLP